MFGTHCSWDWGGSPELRIQRFQTPSHKLKGSRCWSCIENTPSTIQTLSTMILSFVYILTSQIHSQLVHQWKVQLWLQQRNRRSGGCCTAPDRQWPTRGVRLATHCRAVLVFGWNSYLPVVWSHSHQSGRWRQRPSASLDLGNSCRDGREKDPPDVSSPSPPRSRDHPCSPY